MSNIVPFIFENHQVRVLTDADGKALFVAKDVAEALGYKDTVNAIKQHCRGVVIHHPIADALGRTQEVRVIREPDMYRLIFGSNLPSAQDFEKVVVEEILLLSVRPASTAPHLARILPRSRTLSAPKRKRKPPSKSWRPRSRTPRSATSSPARMS